MLGMSKAPVDLRAQRLTEALESMHGDNEDAIAELAELASENNEAIETISDAFAEFVDYMMGEE